jgi:hypothetical protein
MAWATSTWPAAVNVGSSTAVPSAGVQMVAVRVDVGDDSVGHALAEFGGYELER